MIRIGLLIFFYVLEAYRSIKVFWIYHLKCILLPNYTLRSNGNQICTEGHITKKEGQVTKRHSVLQPSEMKLKGLPFMIMHVCMIFIMFHIKKYYDNLALDRAFSFYN